MWHEPTEIRVVGEGFRNFSKVNKNINLLVVRFICEYFGWEHASHKVITGSTPNQLLICWSFSTWGCAHYELPTTLHLHNLRNAPHARVTIGHHTIRNWVAHVDIMPHTHSRFSKGGHSWAARFQSERGGCLHSVTSLLASKSSPVRHYYPESWSNFRCLKERERR